MNRLSLVLYIDSVKPAQSSGSIQFYRVYASVEDHGKGCHGAMVMYSGPAIGKVLTDWPKGKPVKIEIGPGPLGLCIYSLCTEWIDSEGTM